MAESLPLKFYPDSILRQVAADIPVTQLNTSELTELILVMEQTMNDNNGIGLAAPQIGQSIQLCLVKTQAGVLTLINPKILKKSWHKELDEEGCLSIPGVYGTVKRPYKIKVAALSPTGEILNLEAKGLLARVIQHEIDHLNGVLFIDKAREIVSGQDILDQMKNNNVK